MKLRSSIAQRLTLFMLTLAILGTLAAAATMIWREYPAARDSAFAQALLLAQPGAVHETAVRGRDIALISETLARFTALPKKSLSRCASTPACMPQRTGSTRPAVAAGSASARRTALAAARAEAAADPDFSLDPFGTDDLS